MSHIVRREVPRRNRLRLLIIVNFFARNASAKAGYKGGQFSNVAVVVTKPVESDDAVRKW